MMTIDCQVLDTEAQDVLVTYIMREICSPYDIAIEERFVARYAPQFTREEIIASCAVDGALAFYQKYGKKSELTYIQIEEDE